MNYFDQKIQDLRKSFKSIHDTIEVLKFSDIFPPTLSFENLRAFTMQLLEVVESIIAEVIELRKKTMKPGLIDNDTKIPIHSLENISNVKNDQIILTIHRTLFSTGMHYSRARATHVKPTKERILARKVAPM